jgi:acyl-CoA synthetase (AMP-forming)/AMP-acid ligase II/thioesterase domain-containing protein
MEPQHLSHILEAAVNSNPSQGMIIYPLGETTSAIEINYHDLHAEAQLRSKILKSTEGFRNGAPVVIHLNDHLETFFWFWAVIYAGAVPTITSPFSNITEQREQHIQGLVKVLEKPFCITRNSLLHLFDGQEGLDLHTIESLQLHEKDILHPNEVQVVGISREDDLAMLMLTSGSTGNAKAVRLTHKQVIAAVKGKAFFRTLPARKPFLNWIGLDHVASVVEIHLPAMFLGVDQVHVQAADVVARPIIFLDLLSRHRVARTFAPNFFMAKLISTVRPEGKVVDAEDWDLTNLTWMGSGGEANDVDVCVALTRLFTKCGTAPNVIVPGFGMTETCAGCIYNLNCPSYDVENRNMFTSLGKCIPGAQMRVTSTNTSLGVQLAEANEPGNLEVQGSVVFDGYYNNAEATAEAFSSGNWFRTGDQAIIDSEGNLQMIGRTKETLNINGVKHLPGDIESDVEQNLPAQQKVSRIVCFPFRPPGAQTESICITYVADGDLAEPKDLVYTHDLIVQRVMLQTGTQASVFALDSDVLLPKSTLGKISRAKMRTMFEGGIFADDVERYDEAVASHREQARSLRKSDNSIVTVAEGLLLQDFASVLGKPRNLEAWGVDVQIFDIGATSIDLIRLKKHIGTRLGTDIPIITIMLNPTARTLAKALGPSLALTDSASESGSASDSGSDSLTSSSSYNPVVTLRPASQGMTATPLWLIHPGVGEVLVFLGLAQHLPDRPVHALRARGFEPGEDYFSSIDEAVDTYYAAIMKIQPTGPYALAGYSYGSMLAFELAKRFERNGAEVGFLGCFNLPPHIKTRMRQLGWAACLLNLSYFLSLLSEDEAGKMEPKIEAMDESGDRAGALRVVMEACNHDRLTELQLDGEALANWAMLAHRLQGMARDYEPSGSVKVMDVFHAIPLREAARDRRDWLENHLSKWKDYVTEPVVYHEVGGAHYTMLGPEYVEAFAATLTQVLRNKGL